MPQNYISIYYFIKILIVENNLNIFANYFLNFICGKKNLTPAIKSKSFVRTQYNIWLDI